MGSICAFETRQASSFPSETAVAFNLRLRGQYFDVETGTHYNYFRDCDPAIARYVESDPVGLFGGLATYLYAKGNSLRWADSTGQGIGMAGAVIIIGYACFELWCIKRGLDACRRKYPELTDPLSSDRKNFAECQSAIVTICGTLGAFGSDPLGSAATELGGHAGSALSH
jgi:RHS repeat-associated protein